MPAYHKPVMLSESVSALNIYSKKNGVFVDATLGGGGHTKEILRQLGAKGMLIAFDKDSDAIANAPKDKRVIPIHNNFRFVENFVKYLGINKVDGILADLGVSSHQFDTPDRGFSYRFDSPLDMRMNKLAKHNAEWVVNNYKQEDLEKIFREYGELENARKIAELICTARTRCKIMTTGDLCKILARLYNQKTEKKFLGKVFQALRIEVNMEMRALEDFLAGAMQVLNPGGRLSVITYHSLEDRAVKNFIRSYKDNGVFESVTKKPLTPSDEEQGENARSRSAKLRIAEKR